MKRITRLSLALIMFSLLSISYLATTVAADPKGNSGIKNKWGKKPQNAPHMNNANTAHNGNQAPTKSNQNCAQAGNPKEVAACWDAQAPHKFDDALMGGAPTDPSFYKCSAYKVGSKLETACNQRANAIPQRNCAEAGNPTEVAACWSANK
jgi:hypothetical protein